MRHGNGQLPQQTAAASPTWGPNWGLLVVAAILVTSAAAYWFFGEDAPAPAQAAVTPATSIAYPPSAQETSSSVWRIQEKVPTWKAPPVASQQGTAAAEADNDPTRDLSFYVPRGEKPKMADVINRLHEAGVYTGLGAFSPPGTRPPMIGLAVPEDFALPTGYVRHHQATDDGQRIEAILMFAPDFQLLDAQKRPLEMPANRVVPPELAPPGLPIRRIVIPPPINPAQ